MYQIRQVKEVLYKMYLSARGLKRRKDRPCGDCDSEKKDALKHLPTKGKAYYIFMYYE